MRDLQGRRGVAGHGWHFPPFSCPGKFGVMRHDGHWAAASTRQMHEKVSACQVGMISQNSWTSAGKRFATEKNQVL